jgi:C-terminal processing protease CtpA/Prc
MQTGALTTATYRADVNLDRVFDEKDSVADKNLYCLISPVSFSCGNLVPAAMKSSDKVTILGRTSGGGSCTVQPLSTAWGTLFQISGSTRMSFLKNGSFYDIDQGIEPNYTISKPEKFYDREKLTEYINEIIF